MEPQSKWKHILSRQRKQLTLDIEHCSPISLRSIILDVRTPASILERIVFAYFNDEELLRDLIRCPNLTEDTLTFIALTASDDVKNFIVRTRVVDIVMGEGGKAEGAKAKKLNVQQIIQRMTNPQKIKLALSGGKDARGLLIRESSKQICISVLENPRITEGEIEFFAQSQNLGEDIMRKIGTNSEWTRKNSIVRSLVFNPKAPVGISLGFINRMSDRDLSLLEKSRNVPEAIRTASRNLVVKRKLGKG